MHRISNYLIITFGLALLLVSGCSDRGTNVPVQADSGFIRTPQDVKVVPGVHDFYPELLFQIRNEFRLQEIATYIPDVSVPPPYGDQQEVPLLILLPPQDGNQYYYFNHGLQELADELIANGTIRPMIISCISSDKVFGGYFFAGTSPFAGFYDDMIGGSLVDYLNTQFPLLNSPAKRAIGGVGEGAYGALRASILHPNVFTSIAVADGPLDFDGPFGDGGFINLFDDALAEQGLDNSTFKQFDSSGAWDISRMFIGASFAFSPHITAIDWTRTDISPFAFRITLDDSTVITDTTTMISHKFQHAIRNSNINMDMVFHLPFDGNGLPYTPIWNLWLDNNLESLMESEKSSTGHTPLSEAKVMVFTSDQAGLGFHEQTESFVETIKNPPYSIDVSTYNYSGSDNNPASKDQYLYELMKEMLIFHSENFGKVQ